jgi:hypothetical protein
MSKKEIFLMFCFLLGNDSPWISAIPVCLVSREIGCPWFVLAKMVYSQ